MIWECEYCGKRQTDDKDGWPRRLCQILPCCRCKVGRHHDFIDGDSPTTQPPSTPANTDENDTDDQST